MVRRLKQFGDDNTLHREFKTGIDNRYLSGAETHEQKCFKAVEDRCFEYGYYRLKRMVRGLK